MSALAQQPPTPPATEGTRVVVVFFALVFLLCSSFRHPAWLLSFLSPLFFFFAPYFLSFIIFFSLSLTSRLLRAPKSLGLVLTKISG
jgi:hypothetical protein